MSDSQILPLNDLHTSLGARWGEFAGWRMPLWYGGAVQEHRAVRSSAGVFDISHMGRFEIDGPAAAAHISRLCSRDAGAIEVGHSAYGLVCNDDGGIVDDIIVYRLAAERFELICNAANAAVVGAILTADVPHGAAVHDRGPGSVLVAVQGPAARAAVAAVLGEGVLALPRHGCADLLRGDEAYFISRGGYTGEDGFEVMATVGAGGVLLEALVAAGSVPCGLAARDSLRLEAALPLHGSDIDATTSPLEAGLGWALELEHDFTGRAALLDTKEKAARRLACIVADGGGVLRSHQAVLHDGAEVAQLTSGGFAPMLDRGIGLAYLPRALARPGTALEIDLRGRRVAAHTVRRPFYTSPDLARENAAAG